MIQIFSPYPLFLDLNGSPLASGFIYVGEVNQNPETHQIEVFWDEAGTIPASQPFTTINGAIVRNGRPSKIFTEAIDYSITVRDSGNRLVYTAPRSTPDIYGEAAFLFGYLTDIAGTNTITAVSGRSLAGYTEGQRFRFEVANTNTSSVTLNIDGTGPVLVIWPNEDELTLGQFAEGDEVDVQYKYIDNLADYCFIVIQTTRRYMAADSSNITATAAGTADAITATFNPPILALSDTLKVQINGLSPNTVTNPTLNIDGLGAITIYDSNLEAISVGAIPENAEFRFKVGTPNKAILVNPYQIVKADQRNYIINGNFLINQRAYVSGAATTVGQYTFDRWKVTAISGITFSTTNNKTTVTIPAGQTLVQPVEGLNLQSGTYVLSWEGTAQARIGSGSYGSSGQVTASITGGTNTNIEFNEGTVTSVKFELGTSATPFVDRGYEVELALCKRYFEILRGGGTIVSIAMGSSTTRTNGMWLFSVEKRSAPTMSSSTTAANFVVYAGPGSVASSSIPVYTFNALSPTTKSTPISYITAGSLASLNAHYLTILGSSSDYIAADSEI